jgi:hypothetical protein
VMMVFLDRMEMTLTTVASDLMLRSSPLRGPTGEYPVIRSPMAH